MLSVESCSADSITVFGLIFYHFTVPNHKHYNECYVCFNLKTPLSGFSILKNAKLVLQLYSCQKRLLKNTATNRINYQCFAMYQLLARQHLIAFQSASSLIGQFCF